MHIPVLSQETLQYLDPKPNQNFVDSTVGEGGHALQILQKNAPGGKVLGIDWDQASLYALESRIAKHESGKRLVLARGNFADIERIVRQNDFDPVHGVLMDLGMSSWQLEQSGRGFSFLRDEPLDMRFNSEDDGGGHMRPTAEEMVATCSEVYLGRILSEYGGERFSKRIARAVVARRRKGRISRTRDLASIVLSAIPARFRHQKIHAATRTFQALRIAVNDELSNTEKGFWGALRVLEEGGKIVVVSFHSLEDRTVKNLLKDAERQGIVSIRTKKPVTPSSEELGANPRSRSAKLRAAIKVS